MAWSVSLEAVVLNPFAPFSSQENGATPVIPLYPFRRNAFAFICLRPAPQAIFPPGRDTDVSPSSLRARVEDQFDRAISKVTPMRILGEEGCPLCRDASVQTRCSSETWNTDSIG